jgi:hypothetical protein
MATTTPNFGWTVPTSTDLVKDGATAIETLGDSIDASFVGLKGGTTGQVLSKTSGTDLAFTWVAQDDSNAIQNAIVDAKGDLIGATAADTPARLAVGTNGQVLTADSTASTGLKWSTPVSGGMTLINTGGTALTGATTTVGSIPGTYKELKIYVTGWYSSSTSTPNFYLNADTTTSNYAYSGTRLYGSNLSGLIGDNNSTAISYIGAPNTQQNNNLVIEIPNYADTTANKVYFAYSGTKDTSNNAVTMTAHRWNSTAAITTINLQCGAGTWSGGTIYIYGVN